MFTGEEGVLLLLRRYRRPGTLVDMTKETGRNISQLSTAIQFMIEHVHAAFPHLLDERSFTVLRWANRILYHLKRIKYAGHTPPTPD